MGSVHVTGEQHRVKGAVHSFLSNLPEMLGAMAKDPRCIVAICEFADGRYVQFWVEPNGTTSVEVVSNLNIGDAVALAPADEEALRATGWHEPVAVTSPNWRVEFDEPGGLRCVTDMVRHAVYEVLGERPDNIVTLRSFALVRSDEGWREVQAGTRVYRADRWSEIARFLDDQSCVD